MRCKKGYEQEEGKCVKKKNYYKVLYKGNPIVYNVSPVGTGFLGLLTLVFITLKILKIINWSWLWILSPLWIPLAISLIIFLFLYFIFKIFDRN